VTFWILGCGYTGERVARRLLADGARVVGTVRSERAAAELAARVPGLDARVFDVFETTGAAGSGPPHPFAPAAGDVVIDSIPPDLERGPHAARVARALVAAGGGRVVYLSSTGVYARGDGGWIDESTPTAPEGPRGLARVVAEDVYFTAADAAPASAPLSVVSLRIAAIYGPGRGVQERLRAGSYAVPGDGAHFVSRIHVDDLATVVCAAARLPALPRRAYVVADDAPATAREHADGCAALLGLPPPPSIPMTSLSPLAAELAAGNRRVRNTCLKSELGVTLAYPSWREGVPACLQAPTS
jgi:nucleoside-diphosphate-sugar epimerase